MAVRLLILDSAYLLSQTRDGVGVELARLSGGAQALLPSFSALDERQLEAAIQVAEDWLSPHAAALQGEVLEVSDMTGRLLTGFPAVLASTEQTGSIEALEQGFLKVVDMATGHVASPHLQAHRASVADLLLLRELTHHGRVSGVQLMSMPQ